MAGHVAGAYFQAAADDDSVLIERVKAVLKAEEDIADSDGFYLKQLSAIKDELIARTPAVAEPLEEWLSMALPTTIRMVIENWTVIGKIAELLIERGALSFDQVDAVMTGEQAASL
jgi:hypothetical protein